MAKTIHTCPKCGSVNWTFPNPLKVTESMINLPEMVNNLLECQDCGHVGVFFEVDASEIADVQRTFSPRT